MGQIPREAEALTRDRNKLASVLAITSAIAPGLLLWSSSLGRSGGVISDVLFGVGMLWAAVSVVLGIRRWHSAAWRAGFLGGALVIGWFIVGVLAARLLDND